MPNKIQPIKFQASLPPTASAVAIDGQDREITVKLKIPASDFAEGIKLTALTGCAFGVAIYPMGLPDA